MHETEDRLCFRNTGELFIFLTLHPEYQNRVVIQNTDKGIPPFIFKKLSDEKVFIETEPKDKSFSWEECHENASRAAKVPVVGPTDDVPDYSVLSDERMKQLWPIAERVQARFAKMHLEADAAEYNPMFDLRYVGRSGNGTSVKVITKANAAGECDSEIPSVFVKVLKKVCESERHAELEEKILRGLKKRGRNVVKVYGRNGRAIEMQYVGQTIFEYANCLFGNQKTPEMTDAYITESIEEKARIYDDLDVILSQEDKEFIMNNRLKKIISHFPDVDHPFEWMQHFYAYKLMKSMGIKDKTFRDKFTHLFGADLMQAEMSMPGFARFLSDEYTKNRGVDFKTDDQNIDEGLTLAFDFSPKFGLVQQDDFFAVCNLGTAYRVSDECKLIELSMERQGIAEELKPAYLATFVSMVPFRSYLQIGHLIKEQANILSPWHFKIPENKDRAMFEQKAAEMVQQRWLHAREELIYYLHKAKQYVDIHIRESPLANSVEQDVVNLHNQIIEQYRQNYFKAIEPLEDSLRERGELTRIKGYADHWFNKAKINKVEFGQVLEHSRQKRA